MASTDFSPMLAIDMLVRHLPLPLLQSGINVAMKNVASNHAGAFERMGDNKYKYLIIPTDMSVAFIFEPLTPCPKMTAVKNLDNYKPNVAAVISGQFEKLVELMQGKTDGDALFFSRELLVEGDTEAVVSLRNCMDSAEIDLFKELLLPLGPFAPMASKLAKGSLKIFGYISSDMKKIKNSINSDVEEKLQSQKKRISELEKEISMLKKESNK